MAVPHLAWKTADGQESRFEIDRDEISIGRLSESDVVLANPYVSRRHARIVRREQHYYLQDLNSTHGTFVNGRRISEQRLRDADRISFGRDQVEMRFFTGERSLRGLDAPLVDTDLEKSVMQLTSVIPLPESESSHLEKISHILNFQYQWEKSFSPERTFQQILEAALKLSGAERGFILLKTVPSFKYVVGMNGQGELLEESDFRTSHSVVQEVLERGQPVLMTENIDQAFALQQSILAMDLRAVACMPLKWISSTSDTPEVRGILYLDSTQTMHALSGLDQKILNKLAVEAANVFEKLELIQAFEERKALEKELALAQETQSTLLPQQLPAVEGYEITAFSRPTRHVGGDFFDFLPRESSAVTGVLADVSGKGISAALLSCLVQGALQMECRSGTPLQESVTRVNRYLCEKSQSNRFVTLFLFSLDARGCGEYISAGHNPAYVYRAGRREVEELAAGDLILGAFSFATYTAQPLVLHPGDVMIAYTDGITEAMNPRDELFGEERLVEIIQTWAWEGGKALEDRVRDAVSDFTGGTDQTDDMTMVVVQKL
jgi:sigma-B regulation protein RsbU (phosphoserine phosphatase)